MRTISPVLATALLVLGTWAPAHEPAVSAILTSSRSRAAYLAHATMWKDPGDLSAGEILAGPSGIFPFSPAEAVDGVGCTFVTPGKELGGKSVKFLCRTSDGRMLRPKYWDPEREAGQEDDGTCRARLTVSLAAGRDGEGDPEISEGGRRFLLDRLSRLTPAHVRAIFTAARVDQLHRPGAAPSGAAGLAAVDEWVAAFEDKVRQIETHHCQN